MLVVSHKYQYFQAQVTSKPKVVYILKDLDRGLDVMNLDEKLTTVDSEFLYKSPKT